VTFIAAGKTVEKFFPGAGIFFHSNLPITAVHQQAIKIKKQPILLPIGCNGARPIFIGIWGEARL
jgi:hypothetical protein